MIARGAVLAAVIAAPILAALFAAPARAQDVSRPQPPRSGIDFQGEDVRRLQADDFANPGMLWVTRGERLWNEKAAGDGKPCAECHGKANENLKGVATRYPRFDATLGRVVDLSARIDACNRRHQGGPGFAAESEALLSLGAYLAHQSRESPVAVVVDAASQSTFDKGAGLYHQRLGQMNLACTHCHDANWGRTLLNEKISQGQPVGWPAYRLEWQSLGSLQRRIRACFFGVKAEQPAYGSPDIVALEYYLAVRARGLPLEAPGVRR